MIIDTHTHLFPGKIRKNRETYFSDEPAFQKLYQSPKSRLIGAKEMLASMDAGQVDKSVIFGFPWKDQELFKRHNDYISEVVDVLILLAMGRQRKHSAAFKKADCPESVSWRFIKAALKMLHWPDWNRSWNFAEIGIFPF
jgi:hypothetical protein